MLKLEVNTICNSDVSYFEVITKLIREGWDIMHIETELISGNTSIKFTLIRNI